MEGQFEEADSINAIMKFRPTRSGATEPPEDRHHHNVAQSPESKGAVHSRLVGVRLKLFKPVERKNQPQDGGYGQQRGTGKAKPGLRSSPLLQK